jgi:hypothetical protein
MQNGPFHIRRAGSSSLNCRYAAVVSSTRVPTLLQPPDIDPVPDYVNGEAMAETMQVHVLADHHSIPLHQFPGPLLGYREGAHRSRWYV